MSYTNNVGIDKPGDTSGDMMDVFVLLIFSLSCSKRVTS
jgi:hypothetical protein